MAGSKLERAMPGLKERAKTLVELLDNAAFLFAKRPLVIDEQAAKLLDAAGREMLARFCRAWKRVEPWTAEGARSFSASLRRRDRP